MIRPCGCDSIFFNYDQLCPVCKDRCNLNAQLALDRDRGKDPLGGSDWSKVGDRYYCVGPSGLPVRQYANNEWDTKEKT